MKPRHSRFTPSILPFLLVGAAHAASLVLVTGDAGRDADLVAHLESLGHTVTTGAYGAIDTNPSEVAALNSADLVIISRNTNSGDYASGATEVAAWDSLTTPVLLGNAYIARNNRWSYVDTALIQADYGNDISAPSGTATVHPLFAGLTPNTIADPAISGLEKYSFSSSSDIPDGGTVMGDGMTIGVRNNISFQNVIVASWEAGGMTGSGNPLGSDRYFYALPEDFSSFDANGVQLLDNIVDATLVPEPGAAVLTLTFFVAAGLKRRRS
ncbi:hypothetical protein [Haloferula sargassicola]|uniref:Uncharacterized protein n=1 Tax=Haloferula sargassicola TaxID=490096 RepID=A0ABP9UVH6_9BACT